MILFRPEHLAPILEGRKTQTRRLGKRRWKIGAVHQCKLTLFGPPFARIKILDVRLERLGDITDEYARAEGYNSVPEYLAEFERINGRTVPDLPVWVVDFELVKEAP